MLCAPCRASVIKLCVEMSGLSSKFNLLTTLRVHSAPRGREAEYGEYAFDSVPDYNYQI